MHMRNRGAQRSRDLCRKPCVRVQLPLEVAWLVLRFAGEIKDQAGSIMGIVGDEKERDNLIQLFPDDAPPTYTSPGVHNLQLTMAEFCAWRHVEVAARRWPGHPVDGAGANALTSQAHRRCGFTWRVCAGDLSLSFRGSAGDIDVRSCFPWRRWVGIQTSIASCLSTVLRN